MPIDQQAKGAKAAAPPPPFASTVTAARLRKSIEAAMQQPPEPHPLSVSIIGDAFCDVVVTGIQELPQWGGDALADEPIALAAGGSALNTALQLAYLTKLFRPPLPSSSSSSSEQPEPAIVLHTALGSDFFGSFLRDQVSTLSSSLVQLSTSAVSTSTVSKRSDNSSSRSSRSSSSSSSSSDKTGVCVCLSGAHDRAFVTHRGVVASFSSAQIDTALLRQSRVVHIAGWYNCPGLWDDMPALLTECKVRGAFTMLSPQHDASGVWGGLEDLYPLLDVIIPNEAEAKAISGKDSVVEAALFFADKGVKVAVIVTLGAKGAYALVRDRGSGSAAVPASSSSGWRELWQPCPVKEAVDTTGAGDAFGAGVLFSLLAQLQQQADTVVKGGPEVLDWGAALRWGCAAGAHAATKVGASAPPASREEIMANLASVDGGRK